MTGIAEDLIRPAAVLPAAQERRHPVLICASDLHLGLWKERNKHCTRKEKSRALQAIVDLANSQNAPLILNGDIIDDRARRRRHRREIEIARDAFRRCQGEIIFLYGNHDGHLSPAAVRNKLGPCRVVRGLMHCDPSGIVFTHGHMLPTRRFKHLIRRIGGLTRHQWKAINASLKADAALRAELVDYERLSASLYLLERLRSARHGFELAECILARLRTGTARLLDALAGNSSLALQRWAACVDSKMIRRGAQLANVVGAWACIVGHDHTPGLHLRSFHDPITRRTAQVIVGNCGSFIQHGQPITCIMARYPALILMQYDEGSRTMRQVHAITLEPQPSVATPRSESEHALSPAHPTPVRLPPATLDAA